MTGANFEGTTSRGFTASQLYSTQSYAAKDLHGIGLGSNDLTGWDFSGQNLTSANLSFSTLTNANLTGADLRGAVGWSRKGLLGNTIDPDGVIRGLVIADQQLLTVRDDDGVPDPAPSGWLSPRDPIPVTVQKQMTVADGGVLNLVLDADAWGSTISFQPGIPVTIGGTLELTFADDVDVSTQIGRTLDLFDWTGVNPTGQFRVASPYAWDLSHLYTTGDVTLLSVIVGDMNGDGAVDALDAGIMFGNWGGSGEGDLNLDGIVDGADAGLMFEKWTGDRATAVPEASSAILGALGTMGLLLRRRIA